MTWYRRLSDRRGRLRFELVGMLAAGLSTTERLTVLDISARGATVETTEPLPVESAHNLRYAFGDVMFHITARVTHVTRSYRDDGTECYRIGLEFLDVPPALTGEFGQLAGAGLPSGSDT